MTATYGLANLQKTAGTSLQAAKSVDADGVDADVGQHQRLMPHSFRYSSTCDDSWSCGRRPHRRTRARSKTPPSWGGRGRVWSPAAGVDACPTRTAPPERKPPPDNPRH